MRREELARPADVVARRLLGAYLVRRLEGQPLLVVRLVETEAYMGELDPGSHAFRGPTPRNRVMFGEAGHAYVYFTYGNHFMLNVVAGESGRAAAVLVRGGEPVDGMEAMARLRGAARRAAEPPPLPDPSAPSPAYVRWLLGGPARLAAALGVDLDDYGRDMVGVPTAGAGAPRLLRLCRGEPPAPALVRVSGRVGLRRGGDLPLRFFVEGGAGVSRARLEAPARAPEGT